MLIICSECGKEYSDQAKSCPHCGAITSKNRYISNNRGGSYNRNTDYSNQDNNIVVKLFLAILIIAGFCFFSWKIGAFDVIKNIVGSGIPSPDGTYKAVTVDKLYDDLDNNAVLAEDEYVGKYFAVTGQLGIIETNYIGILKVNNDYSLDTVYCYFTNDEQKNVIKTMNKGDIITVKGKITEIKKIFTCYHLNITEIPTLSK